MGTLFELKAVITTVIDKIDQRREISGNNAFGTFDPKAFADSLFE